MIALETPDQVLSVLDQAQARLDSDEAGVFDLRALMWAVINDVIQSYELALDAALPNDGDRAALVVRIQNEVDDYLANHYGDG